MPNCTFFLDNGTKLSTSPVTLPVRSKAKDDKPTTGEAGCAPRRRSSERKASIRQYARDLARAERARNRRRQKSQFKVADVESTENFELTFARPLDTDVLPKVTTAVTNVEHCLRQRPPLLSNPLTPLERYLIASPLDEHWCPSGTSLPTAGLTDLYRESTKVRIRTAIKLATDTNRVRSRAALEGVADVKAEQVVRENERSWLDLDEGSQASRTGVSRTTEGCSQ